MTGEQYLRAHPDPCVREMLARYDRGDFGYVEALELIIARLLDQVNAGNEGGPDEPHHTLGYLEALELIIARLLDQVNAGNEGGPDESHHT